MKLIINQKQENKLIKEYLDKDYGMPLKKYFDDNCDNADFILRRYFQLFSVFLRQTGYNEEDVQHFTVQGKNDPRIDELISQVSEEQCDDFNLWLWQNKQFARHDPEASFFLSNPRLVKERWIIHFTTASDALSICKNGFKVGVPKEHMSQLAYTAKLSAQEKTPDGYVYGYDATKIYNGQLSRILIENAPAAVMCQANGLEIYHNGDREDQVIFLPRTVKNKVLLIKTNNINQEWQVALNTFQEGDLKNLDQKNKHLISPKEYNFLDSVSQWVMDNYQQYKNVICWVGEGLHESVLDEGMLLASAGSPLSVVAQEIGYSKTMIDSLLSKNRASLYPCKELGWGLVNIGGKINEEDASARATLRIANHPCAEQNVENAIRDFPNSRWLISIVVGGIFSEKTSALISPRSLKGKPFFVVEYFISMQKAPNLTHEIANFIRNIHEGEYKISDMFNGAIRYYRPSTKGDVDLMERLSPNGANIVNPTEEEYLAQSGFKTKKKKKIAPPKYIIRADYTSDDLFSIACQEYGDDLPNWSNFIVHIPTNNGVVAVNVDMANEEYTFKNYGSKKVTLKFADAHTMAEGRRIHLTPKQEMILIKENIKIHKGEKGRNYSTQGKWDKEIECPHCGEKAYFSMSISDGERGRGRIKVTDENGKETDSEVQTIALYYCPHCYKFIARNNMA